VKGLELGANIMSQAMVDHPAGNVSSIDGYAVWAAAYDTFENPLVFMTTVAMDAWNGAVSGKRVLELGCGTGRIAPWFLDRGVTAYVGVDESRAMLSQARERSLPRCSFVEEAPSSLIGHDSV
jgi:SAM-dependent methyltransferase